MNDVFLLNRLIKEVKSLNSAWDKVLADVIKTKESDQKKAA